MRNLKLGKMRPLGDPLRPPQSGWKPKRNSPTFRFVVARRRKAVFILAERGLTIREIGREMEISDEIVKADIESYLHSQRSWFIRL